MTSVTKDLGLAKPEVETAVGAILKVLNTLLPAGSFAERERSSLQVLSEAQREFGERELKKMAASFDDEVLVGGKVYRRHERGTRQYHSLSGALTVERDTYREVGVRNGPTIVPLDLEAGLVHQATPALAKNLAHGYAQHDLRAHCQLLVEAHRVPPSRATSERIAKAIAQDATEEVRRIERVLVRSEQIPEEARGVVIGLDRTSTPMAEELPAGTKPKVERHKPYQRQAPKPIEVNWRMAYVATVCLVDENGEALRTYRYAATADDDAAKLAQRMQYQLHSILGRAPELQVGVVQDGAPEMWNEMRLLLQPLKDSGVVKRWYECIDFAHVISRVSEALQLVDRPGAEELEYWRAALLDEHGAIDRLEQMLCNAADDLAPQKLEQLMGHLVYFDNNKDRMRYARLRKAGLPVGSGVTESAAKNVINMRTKRSGQRWSVPGLRGVLTLRALLKSDRLDAFWVKLSRRYVANVNNLEQVA